MYAARCAFFEKFSFISRDFFLRLFLKSTRYTLFGDFSVTARHFVLIGNRRKMIHKNGKKSYQKSATRRLEMHLPLNHPREAKKLQSVHASSPSKHPKAVSKTDLKVTKKEHIVDFCWHVHLSSKYSKKFVENYRNVTSRASTFKLPFKKRN